MAKDSVNKILEAEKAAETYENEARLKASQMVSQAEKDAAGVIDFRISEAQQEVNEILARAKAETEKILDEAKNATQEGFKLSQRSYDKKEEVIKAVIEGLI